MLHAQGHEMYHRLMSKLSSLPKKMLSLHDHDHVTHFVMHELCDSSLLNIDKAAYLVDNQDFDCLQGVAGFCKKEAYHDSCDIWENQKDFLGALEKSDFNNSVRNIKLESMKRRGGLNDSVIQDIARTLHISDPEYYSWNMKHDNHGIFIFQKHDVPSHMLEYLSDSVCLLGFCPIL